MEAVKVIGSFIFIFFPRKGNVQKTRNTTGF